MTAATNSPARFTASDFPALIDALTNRGVGKPVLQINEDLNDTDKVFTVPANVTWEILCIWVELITTATVGNRQMDVVFRDAAPDDIGQARAGAVQAASLTRKYTFAPHAADLTSFRDTDFLMTPLPRIILPATFSVRVVEGAAVDAAADDMDVQMLVMERVEI